MKQKDSMILKKQYNKLIALEHKAGEWLDNVNIPLSEREGKLPDFLRLIAKLSSILRELKKQGVEFTENEILDGFMIEGEVI